MAKASAWSILSFSNQDAVGRGSSVHVAGKYMLYVIGVLYIVTYFVTSIIILMIYI